MEERHLALAKGSQSITHVTYCNNWVACVVEYEDAWLVGAVFLDGCMSSDFLKVLKSTNKTLQGETRATDLSLSSDGVLAVAVGKDGIKLFKMVVPIGPANASVVEIESMRWPGTDVQRAVWIGEFSDTRAMATLNNCTDTDIASIALHGFGEARTDATVVSENEPHQIRFFDACTPGHIAFVSAPGPNLANTVTLLIKTAEIFNRTCIPIGKDSEKAPSALAIGNKLVVVGYSYPPGLADGVGLVEVFMIGHRGLHTTRSIPQSVPTALCTNGDRVLVGASAGIPWGHNTSVSTVYCFSGKNPENFAVAKGGEEHPTWAPRSMCMWSYGWCVARTIVNDSQERFSGIDCASLVAR